MIAASQEKRKLAAAGREPNIVNRNLFESGNVLFEQRKDDRVRLERANSSGRAARLREKASQITDVRANIDNGLPGSHKLAHEIDLLRFITSSQHFEPVRQI